MILYNTLLGVASGAAMVLVAALIRALGQRTQIVTAGWVAAMLALGVVVTFLGAAMAVTWPLKAKPQANILFGEPTLLLGVLLMVGAWLMWSRSSFFVISDDEDAARLTRLVTPLAWLVSVLGLILLVCAFTIVTLNAIGSAPPQEPISGSLPAGVENALVGAMYLLAALGTLPAPWVVRDLGGGLAKSASWVLTIGGVLVLLYSAMNYYTHIGELLKGP